MKGAATLCTLATFGLATLLPFGAWAQSSGASGPQMSQVPPLSGAVMELQTMNARLQAELDDMRVQQAAHEKAITELRSAQHAHEDEIQGIKKRVR